MFYKIIEKCEITFNIIFSFSEGSDIQMIKMTQDLYPIQRFSITTRRFDYSFYFSKKSLILRKHEVRRFY